VHVLKSQRDDVVSGAISPDGALFAAGSRDGTARLWEVATGKQMGEPIRADNGWVTAVAFSPDGTRLVTGGADGAMRLWNVSTRRPADPPLPSHRGPVTGVDFSSDGRRIGSMSYLIDSGPSGAATSAGGRATTGWQLRITDADSGRPIVDGLTELSYTANLLALSPDGRRIAIGSADGKIHVLDADTGAAVGPPISGHADAIKMLAYSGDGRRIVTAGDNTIHVWAADPDQPIGKRLPGPAFVGSLPAAVSPDGHVAATRDVDDQSDIALWRIDTGELVRTISTGYLGPVSALAWRPDGEAIASAEGNANTVRIWDAQTGEPDGRTLTGPGKRIFSLTFSPDGQRLASLAMDSDPWVWDISANPPRTTLLHDEEDYVATAGFSEDGRRLITVAQMHIASGADGAVMDDGPVPETGNIFDDSSSMTPSAVRVWNTDTGQPAGPPIIGRGGRPMDLAEKGEAEMPIVAAAISPNGQRILVSTVKGLRLHDVATGQPVGEPWLDTFGGNNPAVALAFSADGTYAVSVDQQTSALQVRDVQTGRPVGNPMLGHTGAVSTVNFTADGNHIVSRGADGWMLWPGPNSWRDELCNKLTANMTRAEWRDWVSPTIEYQKACPSLDVPE
jgi:WD40 repeat protein